MKLISNFRQPQNMKSGKYQELMVGSYGNFNRKTRGSAKRSLRRHYLIADDFKTEHKIWDLKEL